MWKWELFVAVAIMVLIAVNVIEASRDIRELLSPSDLNWIKTKPPKEMPEWQEYHAQVRNDLQLRVWLSMGGEWRAAYHRTTGEGLRERGVRALEATDAVGAKIEAEDWVRGWLAVPA